MAVGSSAAMPSGSLQHFTPVPFSRHLREGSGTQNSPVNYTYRSWPRCCQAPAAACGALAALGGRQRLPPAPGEGNAAGTSGPDGGGDPLAGGRRWGGCRRGGCVPSRGARPGARTPRPRGTWHSGGLRVGAGTQPRSPPPTREPSTTEKCGHLDFYVIIVLSND